MSKSNISVMSDNLHKNGSTLEGFRLACADVDAHTSVERIDFRTGNILHYDRTNNDQIVYRMIPTLRSSIYKKDKNGNIVMGDYYKVSASELKDEGIGFIQNEVELSSDNHTAFLCDIDRDDDFIETTLFMGETAQKTFSIRMPVADSHSTLGRDIYLAEKLNDLDEMEASGEQKVLKTGECFCTIRKPSEDSRFGKIVSFFGLGHKNHEHKRQSYMSIYDAICELEKKYGKAECLNWSLDAKYISIAVSFEGLTEKMKKLNPSLNYTPCYIFRTSDTGHVASCVKAGWNIDGQVVACGVQAPKEAKKRDNAAEADDLFDFVAACEKEIRVHEMLAAEFSDDEDEIDESELEGLLSVAVKKSGMSSKAGSGAVKTFMENVKDFCSGKMTKNDVRDAVANTIANRCIGNVSEYAEKMFFESVAGAAIASI